MSQWIYSEYIANNHHKGNRHSNELGGPGYFASGAAKHGGDAAVLLHGGPHSGTTFIPFRNQCTPTYAPSCECCGIYHYFTRTKQNVSFKSNLHSSLS